MTGVGGRPELIILGSNSLDGPWEVGFGAFHNTILFCPKIRCFISQVDFISNFRNTTSYTNPEIFINHPLLLVSFLQDCPLWCYSSRVCLKRGRRLLPRWGHCVGQDTQVYKWVPANLMLGVTLHAMDWHPIFVPRNSEISFGLMAANGPLGSCADLTVHTLTFSVTQAISA